MTPGSMDSLLGPMPGSSGITFGMQPGRDDMMLGRIGTSAAEGTDVDHDAGRRLPGASAKPGLRGAAAAPGAASPILRNPRATQA